MQSSDLEPLPPLVFWLFPYNEREMSGQGQRGLLVPDGYKYVSIAKRWCNIKGRLTLSYRNDHLIDELGLSQAFDGQVGDTSRYDIPNHILSGVMIALRGVQTPSNYLAYIPNILKTAQLNFSFESQIATQDIELKDSQMQIVAPEGNTFTIRDQSMGTGRGAFLGVLGELNDLTNSKSPERFKTLTLLNLQGNEPRFPGIFSSQYAQLPLAEAIIHTPAGGISQSTASSYGFGTSKDYAIPTELETPRFPIVEKRLEMELWAPPTLQVELSPSPGIGGRLDYIESLYLWPGEKISEWVNINPINGKMMLRSFFYSPNDRQLNLIAEYEYNFSVDYLIELRLYPSL